MQQQITSPSQVSESKADSLAAMANRLRRLSIMSTSEAGSGHPTSCCSCAELVSTLFFNFLRYDIQNPKNPANDRFVLSKGHAAPILWAVLAEAGAFPDDRVLSLRKIDSDLEGHPTPRNKWVDAATGSLGQGLSIGLGMALTARLDKTGSRVYVLLGDGELAEGAVWEAATLAGHDKVSNLTAIVDANRLGQSEATMYAHNLHPYEAKFQSCGWNTVVIDGHDVREVIEAYHKAITTEDRPTAIIAKTIKGKGIPFWEDENGHHGKPLSKGEEMDKALAAITNVDLKEKLSVAPPPKAPSIAKEPTGTMEGPDDYDRNKKVATRKAYGRALVKLGKVDPRVVALDGDVKNSTYSEGFYEEFPERAFECYIAEQNMVGMAVGFSAMGKLPFASTFACFLTRAYDLIRMAGISRSNMVLCGSHVGVSIGEDGPSQMGLEDMAMMRAIPDCTVLYPSDAFSAERMVALAAETPGIVYIRTSRPGTPILYSADDTFKVGGSKVVKRSDNDQATVVAGGVTVFEALKAHDELAKEGINIRVIDLYSVKPVDVETLRTAVRETGALVTVEDHYPEGGLGEAVASSLLGEQFKFKLLAVNGIPRSGGGHELMDKYGISSRHVVAAVKELLGR